MDNRPVGGSAAPDHHDAETGASAIPDRASSAGSGASATPARQGTQVGNARVTPLPLDTSALRSSLAAIETALEREGAFQQLQLDYANLQQQLRTAEHRLADLANQSREAAQLASPFVQFCQHRYDLVRHDLRESRKQFNEVVNALAGHEGDRIRIANLESQLQTARQQHQDAIADQGRIISDLTDQLAAALLRAPTVNSQELQRLRSELDSSIAAHADLQQALQQAMAARDRLQAQLVSEIDEHQRTRHELAEAHDSNSALAASQDALEGAVDQLKRQLGTAQQNLTNVRASCDAHLDRAISERDQACVDRDQAILDLQDRETKLRRARSDRDRARDEMRSYQAHVDAARQSVARLEQQVATLQTSADDLRQLRADNDSLQTSLAS